LKELDPQTPNYQSKVVDFGNTILEELNKKNKEEEKARSNEKKRELK